MFDEILKKILKLSYFNLNKQDFEKISNDFKTIVQYVEKIKQAQIKDEEPFSHFRENIENLRKDEEVIKDDSLVKKLKDNAPLKENDFFKTKKIL